MLELARIVLAVLALLFALQGVRWTVRARIRLNVRGVLYLLLAGGALGVAWWLGATPPEEIEATLRGLVERFGLEGLVEALRELVRQAAESLGVTES